MGRDLNVITDIPTSIIETKSLSSRNIDLFYYFSVYISQPMLNVQNDKKNIYDYIQQETMTFMSGFTTQCYAMIQKEKKGKCTSEKGSRLLFPYRLYQTLSIPLVPGRFQRNCEIIASADELLGNARDSICAGADARLVRVRNTRAHTVHTHGLPCAMISVAEAYGRSKVESAKGS